MRALLWSAITWIVTRPTITALLIRLARRRPYLHIGDYMYRWWLVPYEWRLPFAIRIHHIMRPDADPYLHDHPWPWRTIVLRGRYVEEDVFGGHYIRYQGETRAASAETLHRIAWVSSGGVWTLFITGRKSNAWGFMVPAGGVPRKVYYQNYISENGRGELHSEPVKAVGGVQ